MLTRPAKATVGWQDNRIITSQIQPARKHTRPRSGTRQSLSRRAPSFEILHFPRRDLRQSERRLIAILKMPVLSLARPAEAHIHSYKRLQPPLEDAVDLPGGASRSILKADRSTSQQPNRPLGALGLVWLSGAEQSCENTRLKSVGVRQCSLFTESYDQGLRWASPRDSQISHRSFLAANVTIRGASWQHFGHDDAYPFTFGMRFLSFTFPAFPRQSDAFWFRLPPTTRRWKRLSRSADQTKRRLRDFADSLPRQRRRCCLLISIYRRAVKEMLRC